MTTPPPSLFGKPFFLLKLALLLVGLHSIILGLVLFFFTEGFYRFFFSVPAENVFFVRQAGLFLSLMGLFYLSPLLDIQRSKGLISIIILSKVSAVWFILANARLTPAPDGVYLAALGDGAMAAGLLVLSVISFRKQGEYAPDGQAPGEGRSTDGLESLPEISAAFAESAVGLSVEREIQRNLIDLVSTAFQDRKEVSVCASLQPAREGGVDFYHCFFIDKDHFCFFIGQASGKGVKTVLGMVVSATLIKARSKTDPSPAGMLNFLNTELARETGSDLPIPLFLGVLNVATGELVYSNAGSTPPYIKRKEGGVQRLDIRHGPVVGSVSGMVYKENSQALSGGDFVILCGQGITRVKGAHGRVFSNQRLEEVLQKAEADSADGLVRSLESGVREFTGAGRQSEDITILAVGFAGRPHDADVFTLELTIRNQLEEIGRAIQYFDSFIQQGSVAKKVGRQIKIALDEMLNNIISHAFEDGAQEEIKIRMNLEKDRLELVIADGGESFNPFDRAEPETVGSLDQREAGGMGISLVRNIMDEVGYQRRAHENISTLIKYLGSDSRA